jgi:hypothetical protein
VNVADRAQNGTFQVDVQQARQVAAFEDHVRVEVENAILPTGKMLAELQAQVCADRQPGGW